ncbi:hypothetical protein JYU34_018358 [Plutella xylostella]|uniref:Succinate dehydrogenase [ubiquinone] cytochrome b small subunit n=1 Tax=Plutella xylostella TaxID=51655 RepID=A0ABQ7PXN4_PLUXY|nr:hypothetical protein JYU34_018358 [Plutella xylostella]
MAFSMFLRNSACTNRVFTQQLMRMASQATLTQTPRLLGNSTALAAPAFKQTTTTPLLDAVRSLRTSAPRLSEKGSDHAKLWVIEKSVTVAMLPLIPLGLAFPSKIIDAIVAVLITAHSFWGLEAIAVDYVRAAIFGPFIPKVAIALVYLISIATLGGLFYIISHDVGLANTFLQLWAVKSQKA